MSCIMPVIHPYVGGAVGTTHGADYFIKEPEMTCVNSTKIQLVMLTLLLQNNAERAKQIVKDFVPLFASKEEYLAYIDNITSSGDRIIYYEGDRAEINLK